MDPRGARLRRLLAAFADHVEPGDGLPAIRARIQRKTAAPGATRAAAKADHLRGQPAMANIIHHEDASVYGKGVIHHPLSGRPEYKGIVTSPDGPMVRIQDGDLVLHIDDAATLTRWRRAFEIAEAQLALATERTNGSTR